MSSLNKRLDRLERIERTKSKDRAEWHYMVLPDNGRYSGGFHVFTPYQDHIIIVPTAESVWPDGSRVFDSLKNPPLEITGRLTDLTEAEWSELRKAEKFHQRGNSK
jgi:hypothetical protein